MLEDATFTVTELDIVDSTNTSITINGTLEIEGLDARQVSKISLESIDIRLFNGSQDISSFKLPIDSSSLKENTYFEITVEIDPDQPDDLTVDMVSDILFGEFFFIEFEGTIQYRGLGINDQLVFRNKLNFDLEQIPLSIYLQEILMPSNQTENPVLSILVYSPFALAGMIEGDFEVVLDDIYLGYMNLSNTQINKGDTYIQIEFHINSTYEVFFGNYLANINSEILLTTDLNVSLGQLYLEIDPIVELEGETYSINTNITDINDITLSTDIILDVNANISTDIPTQFNLTSFEAFLYSETNEVMGSIFYQSNQSITMSSNVSVLEHIIVNASLMYVDTITGDLLEGRVILKDIFLGLELYGQNFIFNIEDSVFILG